MPGTLLTVAHSQTAVEATVAHVLVHIRQPELHYLRQKEEQGRVTEDTYIHGEPSWWKKKKKESKIPSPLLVVLSRSSALVLDSGTREPLTQTGINSFAKNRNQKFENSPYLEPNRNRLNNRRVLEGS